MSGNFFTVLRVEPQIGRTFRTDEDQVPGRDAVVVLGYAFRQQQFGGDPSVLGRKVLLNGIEFTVVGVAPDSFPGLNQFVRYDFYAPLMMWPRITCFKDQPARDARRESLHLKGRLKPGVKMQRRRRNCRSSARIWKGPIQTRTGIEIYWCEASCRRGSHRIRSTRP